MFFHRERLRLDAQDWTPKIGRLRLGFQVSCCGFEGFEQPQW